MTEVTFKRGEVREEDITGLGVPERVVAITSYIDGVEAITLDWHDDVDEATIHEHFCWELRRRGLLSHGKAIALR